ncbi:MAG: sugar isomerase, partial [Bacteroidota bacterium]
DLDAGSIKPFQLFLIFHELIQDALRVPKQSRPPAYMIDQSHNVTDPIESLMNTVEELQRAYAQALLVDREGLSFHQENNDAIMALKTLKKAFVTDVSPILAMARYRSGGAIDPLRVYRESRYRKRKAVERPAVATIKAGIV